MLALVVRGCSERAGDVHMELDQDLVCRYGQIQGRMGLAGQAGLEDGAHDFGLGQDRDILAGVVDREMEGA